MLRTKLLAIVIALSVTLSFTTMSLASASPPPMTTAAQPAPVDHCHPAPPADHHRSDHHRKAGTMPCCAVGCATIADGQRIPGAGPFQRLTPIAPANDPLHGYARDVDTPPPRPV